MAQIKKLQPGGKSPEKTTPKYGRLIQNGVEFQANDDMINWLSQQGYYGEQMANNLRNGDDQYLDTDEQGVGWIRNISAANPDLKEKQQERTTRASRRLEGRRLNQARTDIQRLATYDYSKFNPTPATSTAYPWGELVVNYNIKKSKDGKDIIEYSDHQDNFKIEQRLKAIADGLVISEGQKLENRDDILAYWNTVKDLFEDTVVDGKVTKEGLKTRMKNGTMTENDWDILKAFNIVQKSSNTTPVSEDPKEKEKAVTTAVSNWLSENLKLNAGDVKTHSAYWTVGDDNQLTATQSLYDTIGGTYKNYWFGPESPYKDYVLLNGKLVSKNLVDKNGKQTTFGKWWESSDGQEFRNKYAAGLWSDAAKHMAFEGSDNTWQYVDPYTQVSPYLKSGMVYRDVSSHYDFDPVYEYVGAITKMDDPVNGELLPSYRDYAITKDGTLVDISTIGGRYTRPIRPSSRPTKLNVYTLNPNGNFREFIYQYIDNLGKTHDIIVTLDQTGRVVKLTEDGKDHEVLDQKDTQNNGTDIWKTIKEYLDKKTGPKARKMDYSTRIKEKQDQGMDSFQPGGKLKSPTENKKYIQQVGAITDPTKSYSTKDFKEGFEMNDYDKAELAGLIADGVGLLATLVPGYGNVAAAGLGAVSSGANFYASLRDGFQLSDVLYGAGDLAMTLGTLVPGAGTSASLAKLTKGVVKAHKFLAPLFIGYGLYDGYDGLTKMLSGDFNIQDARAVANGLMALRGIVGNKKSHRTTRKYGVELDSEGKPRKPKITTKENPLDTFLDNNKGDKNIEKLKKEIVDNLVKDNPNLKTLADGSPVEWVDKDMKISDYEKAWEGLRKKSDHITDEMIVDNRTWQQGLGMKYQKVKQVVSDAAEKGTNWFKQYIGELVVPADPTKYGLNPELDAVDLKAAKENRTVRSFMGSSPETWVLSNKKGGKIRKCRDGDEFDQWNDEINWENDNMWSMEQGEPSLIGGNSGLKPVSGFDPNKDYGWKLSGNKENGYKAERTSTKSSTVSPIKKDDLNIPFSNSSNPGKGQRVAGSGDGINWSSIGEGLIGNGARAAAYLTTPFTNKRVLDHALDAIRSKYLGAMKSMPIQQPLQRYNITPMTSLFDKQRTEFRNASRQIAKNFADSKLQMAQFLATEDQIAKREDNLLNQISKHVTDVDLAKTQLRAQYAKDEQAIADYNSNLGGQQKAEESMAYAQHAQKQGDNFNKAIAEFRTDWNKYLAQKDQMDLYKNYQDIFDKYRNAPEGSKEKAEYANQIGLLTYLIKNGTGARNPITYGRSFT